MKSRPVITSFNAGELSPLIGGRPDLEKYRAGLSRCENFLPRVQGAATRRGGTRFVAPVKDAAQRAWLVPFEFAVNDAFVLEFGDGYIRFYRDRGVFEIPLWTADEAYVVGDLVMRSHTAYRCIAANTNHNPPDDDGSRWTSLSWDHLTAYVPGDIVSRSNELYQARKPTTGVDPANPVPSDSQWFHMDGSGPDGGVAYEIWSPYAAGDLTSAKDATFALRYEQSGDVINFAHPKYRPFKLTRYANYDWRVEEFVTVGGPFKDQNEDKDSTVRVTAFSEDGVLKQNDGHTDIEEAITSGLVTLTASKPIFQPGHKGALFMIQMLKEADSVRPWYVYKPTINSDRVSSDGKYYVCTDTGPGDSDGDPTVTGTEKPVHTEDALWDGDGEDVEDDGSRAAIGALWEYLHPGYGWVRIKDYHSPTEVTADVVSTLPIEVTNLEGQPDATWRWAHAAWSDAEGWPGNVTYFRERLTFSKDRTLYFSQAGDFPNFKARDFGEVLASSAVILTIGGGTGDPIEWLAPTDRLLVGTGGSVHAVGESSISSAFGPANNVTKDQVIPGANGVQPVLADAVIYVEKAGRIVDECAYAGELDKFAASDLTVFAEHLTREGVIAMALHRQPYSIIWCVTAAGGLMGLTYRKQQQVIGWSRFATDGKVESIAVIPSPDGGREDLWLSVARTRKVPDPDPEPGHEGDLVDRVERYVEVLCPEYQAGDLPGLMSYSDCSLVYDGALRSVVGGLDHLTGRTVNVLADGAAHPPCVVAQDGTITLDYPASQVVAGLAAPAYLELMPLETGSALGSSLGGTFRICKVVLRLIESLGGKVGPSTAVADAIAYRRPDDRMDLPPPVFTGDMDIDFPGDATGRATVAITCEQDFPFTVAAMAIEVTTDAG